MTFKELIDSVNFDNVAPHIVRMYPDMEGCLGWFNLHFDLLRMTEPQYHKGANADVCHITMKDWEDGTGLHLDAHPMEGDYWEHSLTKEIILAPDVKATKEEIAACCMWHTTFYGFIELEIEDRLHIGEECNQLVSIPDSKYYRKEAEKYFYEIRKNGGIIPSLRELPQSKKKELIKKSKVIIWYIWGAKHKSNKAKRKGLLRKAFLEKYYERMRNISENIVSFIPDLSREGNYINMKHLCRLFYSDLFATIHIQSYADENTDGATYLRNLFSKYDMLPAMDHVLVYIQRGSKKNDIQDDSTTSGILRPEEKELFETISKKVCCKGNHATSDYIIGVNPKLGHQTFVNIIGYNADKPITFDIYD